MMDKFSALQKRLIGTAAGVTAAVTLTGFAWKAGTETGYRFALYKELLPVASSVEALMKADFEKKIDLAQVMLAKAQRQLDIVTDATSRLEWSQLNEKNLRGELSPYERQHFCDLSRALGYDVPGCAR